MPIEVVMNKTSAAKVESYYHSEAPCEICGTPCHAQSHHALFSWGSSKSHHEGYVRLGKYCAGCHEAMNAALRKRLAKRPAKKEKRKGGGR